jgi:hypothetical protein
VDWPGLVRRYVWDEQRTPYLVPAERLTDAQARNELFVYAFLLATLAAVMTAAGLLGAGGGGWLTGTVVPLYGTTLLLAAIVLGATGHRAAAWHCATAPALLWIGALTGALRPGMTGVERLALAVASALWMAYAVRVVRITRRLSKND